MKLSVIIVSYNVKHFLEQCLRSVLTAAEGITFEIFVVDNNSADGSCSMVRTSFPGVFLIRNPVNAGFAAACNQAINLAKGEYILLLNPDTVVEEDTFTRCIAFMDGKKEAGALGVKMINGNGKLLPESKRAFPTPATAFYKMTGLSRLFPKSKTFNRYYLGHLDNSVTAEADIISGAFMFIRREALNQTGPLDESYFMYGEDIDLSYRLLKAGFRNYYFPEVKIIHYKGESTRKSDLNYVIQFYRAMLIFINKHFGRKENKSLIFLLRFAIYFHGFVSLLKTLLRKYFLPITDALLMVCVFLVMIPLWEKLRYGGEYSYPRVFKNTLIPAFTFISLLSVYLTGGYKIPSKVLNVIKGLLTGTVSVLVIYALLPQEARYSRAVVVLGGVSSVVIIPLVRVLFAFAGLKLTVNPFARAKRAVIVSAREGYSNISGLFSSSDPKAGIAGRVSIMPDDFDNDVLGHLGQIREIIRVNRIDEVIFSTRDLTASQIINSMHILSGNNITVRIAPQGEKLLIGSNSVKLLDELYHIENSPD